MSGYKLTKISRSNNVLVIGGNRFFGKKLVARLLAAGQNVTLLNRQNSIDGFGNNVSRLKCDRKNASALAERIGNSKWDLVYDQVCFEANDAKAACEIFRGRTPRYIFTSSLSVYGPGACLSESQFDPFTYQFSGNADAVTQYAEAKRQCETIFHSQRDFEVVSVRFPFVLGLDDYTNRLNWHIRRALNGEEIYFPNLNAKASLINSDDAALILHALSQKKFAGPINVCSDDAVAMSELLDLIETRIGEKINLAPLAGTDNQSPYGIADDWFMSVAKLHALDLSATDTARWLPELVSRISAAEYSLQ